MTIQKSTSGESISKVAEILRKSGNTIAFTGAGISVESGIPPFRGENGLWGKYDAKLLELNYFKSHPVESWQVIKEIFYDFFGVAKPNKAHLVLAEMEQKGLLNCIITQNIDNLHQEAGSKIIHEFHGNSKHTICLKCGDIQPVNIDKFLNLPPKCDKCGGLLKPDFIFFGEGIPPKAYEDSVKAAESCEVCIIIGSTGEVMPACYMPVVAKQNGAAIIEINPEKSSFTGSITDIHLKVKAGEIMEQIGNAM